MNSTGIFPNSLTNTMRLRVVGMFLWAAIACPAQVTITEYPVPSGGAPYQITSGPDSNLWFTENVNRVGRITMAGAITEFTFGTNGNARGITLGPDGNIWFIKINCCFGPNSLIQMTPAGVIVAEYPAPWSGAFGGNGDGGFITAGPNGRLWATGLYSIHELAPNGANFPSWVGEHVVPNAGNELPWIITPGPDGNLWYSIHGFGGWGQSIGRITPTGGITNFPIAQAFPGYISRANSVTAGPDGALWFTGGIHPLSGQLSIGRITTSGVVTYYPISSNLHAERITTGPDGNLWLPETTSEATASCVSEPIPCAALFAWAQATSSQSPVRTSSSGRLGSSLVVTAIFGSPCPLRTRLIRPFYRDLASARVTVSDSATCHRRIRMEFTQLATRSRSLSRSTL